MAEPPAKSFSDEVPFASGDQGRPEPAQPCRRNVPRPKPEVVFRA